MEARCSFHKFCKLALKLKNLSIELTLKSQSRCSMLIVKDLSQILYLKGYRHKTFILQVSK